MKSIVSTLILLILVGMTPAMAQSHTDVAPLPSIQQEEAAKENITVLAFTSDNCRQCQVDKPELQKLRGEGYNVVEIDVDEQPEVADRYGVTELPTYVVEYEGTEVRRTHKAGWLGTILIALLVWIFS